MFSVPLENSRVFPRRVFPRRVFPRRVFPRWYFPAGQTPAASVHGLRDNLRDNLRGITSNGIGAGASALFVWSRLG